MGSIAIMVGGAVLNAAAFIGGNYLAQDLGGAHPKAAQERTVVKTFWLKLNQTNPIPKRAPVLMKTCRMSSFAIICVSQ